MLKIFTQTRIITNGSSSNYKQVQRFFLVLLLVLPSLLATAQDFNKAIGLRGGLTSGFEYRFYTNETQSFKILLGTNSGVRLHGLMEFHRHNLFLFTDQLTLYYGAGIHGGYENWDKKHVHNNTQWYENRTAFVMGFDGLAGIEYTFMETPLSVGMESKPYFDIFGRNMFNMEFFDLAFTVKYLF